MKQIYLKTIKVGISILMWSTFARGGLPSIDIAILDVPVDVTTETPRWLATDWMRALSVRTPSGERISWWDLNLHFRSGIEAAEKQHWDSLSRSMGKRDSFKKMESLVRFFHGESHGQNCAALISRIAVGDRVLFFPWMPEPHYLTPAFFDDLSDGLRKAGVATVNISVAFSPETIAKSAKNTGGWWRQWTIRRTARQQATVAYNAFTDFVRKNPKIVFVIAAGNQGADLATLENHTSALKEPNVLVVGAVDMDGRKAEFSNWSPEFVQVAAVGVKLPIETPHGIVEVNGTSYAAPQVSAEIAQIRRNHPELDSTSAIQEFLMFHTDSRSELSSYFENGRVLKDRDDREHSRDQSNLR